LITQACEVLPQGFFDHARVLGVQKGQRHPHEGWSPAAWCDRRKPAVRYRKVTSALP